MRLIVDTNCLLVSVPRRSPYRWLYDAILIGRVELAVTTEILLEYEEQLGLFYAPDYAEYILATLTNLPNIIQVNPLHFYWLLIENDPDDNKFVDTAIAANADYIITNDRHYQILQKVSFPTATVVRLDDFQSILAAFSTTTKS
ncbi:putative toxin-antitoxin system toxin component, PIN family [Spirosoma montaniterrae]|uniref:PIN domain-containing protein n=1 Tax=Spirosoma montaniterrae TaxID=1178516 RepID=A0A1P9WZQ4_9BACT|nr:putative toxin-antitoxin system toxin component, PIN family [Spirosoma montaniterrae]AQG80843.1 hypothetical protein AWR27_16865 [Spirosoma montaniterrae]